MKICQSCNEALTDADLAIDPYTQFCQTCWELWQIDAGTPLERYGQPGTVCAACGMGFGGVTSVDRHRLSGRCLSPAELKAQNRPMIIKGGIWVKDSSQDAFFTNTGKPRSDFADKTIATPHLESSDALQALPCGSGGIA